MNPRCKRRAARALCLLAACLLAACLLAACLLAVGASLVIGSAAARAAEVERPVERTYVTAPPAPRVQAEADVGKKSAGCLSCHTSTDAKSMHVSPAVRLGCADCHGGSADVVLPPGATRGSKVYRQAFEAAHVLPRYPRSWHYPSSANPERTYTLLNRESPEFIRFINPGDLRVAREACGACHPRSSKRRSAA